MNLYMSRFKDKERVVCINTIADMYDGVVDLRYGEIYEVIEDSMMDHTEGIEFVFVKDESGSSYDYGAYRFISVSEYRSGIIDEILD